MKNLRPKPDMTDQNKLKAWIESNCPLLWSLLNTKAQRTLPGGLFEYIAVGSPFLIELGRNNLVSFERHLKKLNTLCGRKTVSDNYRRDLSGVDSAGRVDELYFEIALCASVGKFSGKLKLHPPTGKGTYSDCCFYVNSFEIYGEVKRYLDPFPHIEKPGDVLSEKAPYTRSIAKRALDGKPDGTARPRSMDLGSKLRDVHKQFPEGTLNILFVFNCSLAEPKQDLTQALFGEANFFNNEAQFILKSDGLFYLDEWRNISACSIASLSPEIGVIFPFIWKNPRAQSEIPMSVLEALS